MTKPACRVTFLYTSRRHRNQSKTHNKQIISVLTVAVSYQQLMPCQHRHAMHKAKTYYCVVLCCIWDRAVRAPAHSSTLFDKRQQ